MAVNVNGYSYVYPNYSRLYNYYQSSPNLAYDINYLNNPYYTPLQYYDPNVLFTPTAANQVQDNTPNLQENKIIKEKPQEQVIVHDRARSRHKNGMNAHFHLDDCTKNVSQNNLTEQKSNEPRAKSTKSRDKSAKSRDRSSKPRDKSMDQKVIETKVNINAFNKKDNNFEEIKENLKTQSNNLVSEKNIVKTPENLLPELKKTCDKVNMTEPVKEKNNEILRVEVKKKEMKYIDQETQTEEVDRDQETQTENPYKDRRSLYRVPIKIKKNQETQDELFEKYFGAFMNFGKNYHKEIDNQAILSKNTNLKPIHQKINAKNQELLNSKSISNNELSRISSTPIIQTNDQSMCSKNARSPTSNPKRPISKITDSPRSSPKSEKSHASSPKIKNSHTPSPRTTNNQTSSPLSHKIETPAPQDFNIADQNLKRTDETSTKRIPIPINFNTTRWTSEKNISSMSNSKTANFPIRDQIVLHTPNPETIVISTSNPKIKLPKKIKYLGVFETNPLEYVKRYGMSKNNITVS